MNEVLMRIVQTGKLSVDQMLNIGNQAKDSDVWQAIVQKINWTELSVDQMLNIGNQAKDNDVWQAISTQLDK